MLVIPLWYRLSIRSTIQNPCRRIGWYQDFYYIPTQKKWWAIVPTGEDMNFDMMEMKNRIDGRNGLIKSVTEIMGSKYYDLCNLDPSRIYINELQFVIVDDRYGTIKVGRSNVMAGPNDGVWWPKITANPNRGMRNLCYRPYNRKEGVRSVGIHQITVENNGDIVGVEGMINLHNTIFWKRILYTKVWNSESGHLNRYRKTGVVWAIYRRYHDCYSLDPELLETRPYFVDLENSKTLSKIVSHARNKSYLHDSKRYWEDLLGGKLY